MQAKKTFSVTKKEVENKTLLKQMDPEDK